MPLFTSQPSNPSSVVEGADLILQWSYDLEGRSISLAKFANVTGGAVGAPNVAIKGPADSNATVQPGYEQQFRAALLITQATLTILAAPRSYGGDKYQFSITTDGDFLTLPSDVVEISVLCEY